MLRSQGMDASLDIGLRMISQAQPHPFHLSVTCFSFFVARRFGPNTTCCQRYQSIKAAERRGFARKGVNLWDWYYELGRL